MVLVNALRREAGVPYSADVVAFQEVAMAKYLVRASYTSEGAKGLMKDGGTKRAAALEAALKGVGGKLDAFYFALGEHDVYAIIDAPDVASVSALALVTNASGAVRVSTTVLVTPQEVDAAAKKTVQYTPPGR
jgi:uncharacterized protein with GYD domain